MQVCTSLASVPTAQLSEGTVVAIGKFDGVHLGHQQLLARSVRVAETEQLTPVVMTFSNNPLSFLRPDLCPDPLMSVQQRVDALAHTGAAFCVMLPFDAELAQMSAEAFVTEILVDRLRVKHLIVGADFRFGARGIGSVEMLTQMSAELGFTVEVLSDVSDPQLGKLSSSRVREVMLAGDVAAARRMLGRFAQIRGTVVHGDARGREIGFPTANLGSDREGIMPADGVYAGWAEVAGQKYAAAISVGANVTFDPEGERRLEAFLLDFSGDLYGAQLTLSFVERIRSMEKFSGVEELIEQMNRDVEQARTILST